MLAKKPNAQEQNQIQEDLTEIKANLEWQSRTIRNLSESVDKRFDAVNVQLYEIRDEIRGLSKLVKASLTNS